MALPLYCPEQPGDQAGWMMIRMKNRPKQKFTVFHHLDSEETLKVLAKDKRKCCSIIMPFGINNTWLHELDVIKINVASVCNFA